MTPLASRRSGGANPRPHAGDIRIADARTRNGLDAIRETNVEMAIWRRALPACLSAALRRTDPANLPDFRLLVRRVDAEAAVSAELGACDALAPPIAKLLTDDIIDLVDTYTAITGTKVVDIRLERITDDACRRFHRDRVRMRLLTTYLGPGSEWVEPPYAEIALRNEGRFCIPIRRLDSDDVAIFRGCLDDPARGLAHRSPPIEATGETRLLLCLNEPSNASPELWMRSRAPI
jgi:hypothetical protein